MSNTGSSSPGDDADDLKHFRCCGLLLQRLCQVARLRLHLLEQTDIPDGDHRLIREGLQQGNLFVAERMDLAAAEHDRSDALVLAQQRHAQDRAMALMRARLRCDVRKFVTFGGQHVVHMHRFLVDERASGDPVRD